MYNFIGIIAYKSIYIYILKSIAYKSIYLLIINNIIINIKVYKGLIKSSIQQIRQQSGTVILKFKQRKCTRKGYGLAGGGFYIIPLNH